MIGTSATLSLPPQMMSLKEKNEKWQHDCMDALESIGRHQYLTNAKLVENYEMVRGRFIYSHYIEREEYADMLTQLTKEFEMPSHLRHYDIISQVINTLSGEYQKRPDMFRVEAYDERAQNEYTRQKSQLLIEYVMEGINNQIEQGLIQAGLDPRKNPDDQEYQQQVAQKRQALTPPEIERYMQTNWMDAAEMWAQNQLEFDKRRHNLKEKEKIEFEDMLVADRCFRHFYLTADGYNQETWNPIHTFYHKSPEVIHIEEGDYAGRVFFMTIPEIINRYGHKMTEKQLLSLEKFKKDSYTARTGVGFGELSWAGIPSGVQIPYQDYPQQHFVQAHLGFDPNNPEAINLGINQALGTQVDSSPIPPNPYALFQVTEAYWMSHRKLGKVVFEDPDDPTTPGVMIVDETVKLPSTFKEITNSFMEFGNDERVNTVTWTWAPQVWKGIKINNRFVNMEEPIYLDIGPNEFQFKGDHNIYGAKLPVCGQVFNNRNADSMSLVDMMKPHQIGYNVAMNQLYEIMQREVGRFMLMDFNFIPSGKDWGGERNYERLMLIARQLGIAPLDGSPTNTKGSSFAHFQPVDLDESARMLSRMKIAEFFENCALKQVGITPQRLGEVAASETATGTQQAVNQSYAQTESYFTNFSAYKTRCLQMALEMAQYVESKKDNITMMFIKSDMSRAFIKMAGVDLLLSELGVYVSDSAEMQRQLEMLRQLFMESNTTGATPVDLATVIMSNSPNEIKAQLKASYEALQAREQSQQQSEMQAEQQKQQMAMQLLQEKQSFDAQQRELDRANERYIAEVKALGTVSIKNSPDMDNNGIPDVLEVQRLDHEINVHSEDILFKNRQEQNKVREGNRKLEAENKRTELERDQLEQQKKEHEDNVKLKREEMKSKEKIAKSKPKPKSK